MHKLAIGIVAATMTIAACGGSSKAKSTDTGAGATTTTSAGGGSNSGGGNSGGGSSDVSKVNIKVTYAETDTGTDGKTTTSMLTIAQNGKGKSFFAESEAGDTPADASTIYTDGTTTVECQGTGTTAQCTSVPAAAGGSVAAGVTEGFTQLAALESSLGGGDKSSESIAGRDASCVKYRAGDVVSKMSSLPFFKGSDEKASDYDANDTFTICTDKDTGFPLKFGGTKKGADDGSLVATAVSEPTDADFTPPVTPVTVPGAGSVTTLPAG
jgi:hypothetical protein